jgi:hypothetical protein
VLATLCKPLQREDAFFGVSYVVFSADRFLVLCREFTHDLIVKDLNQIVSKENIKLTERHLHTIEVYLVCSSWSYSA